MNIRKIFKDIREFFWPLLDKADSSEIREVSLADIDLEKEVDIKTAFELVQKVYYDEQDRNKTIETKSVVLIGSIGFVVTLIIGITNFLLTGKSANINAITIGMVLAAIVLIVYFIRSSWYSMKALTRQKIHVLHFKDIIRGDKNYKKQIIAKIINNSQNNAKIINIRVDYMTAAQEYYKRAIIVLFIYCLFVFALIIEKLQAKSDEITVLPERIYSLLGRDNLSHIAVILILLINTTLLGVIIKRIKH